MSLCKGIKKNGTRCSRSIFNPTSNNEYCYQHRSDRYTYVAKDKVEVINPVNVVDKSAMKSPDPSASFKYSL